MKKVLIFMLVSLVLVAFTACGGAPVESDGGEVDVEATEVVAAEAGDEKTEEEIRIEENNAVILPKLAEVEAIIAEMEAIVAASGTGEKFQSYIDQMREELVAVTQNHQKIIDMGGYQLGTADFEMAIDGMITNDTAVLGLIIEEAEIEANSDLTDKYNALVDIANEVVVAAQANGWAENEGLLSDMKAVYSVLDELEAKIAGQEMIEETYRNEKMGILDELILGMKQVLEVVSVTYTE